MSFFLRATTRMHSFDYNNGFSDCNKQSRVVQIHSADQWRSYFDASKNNNKLVVIEFTATWCKVCQLIAPTIQDLANVFTDVDFIKIDVDKLMAVADVFETTTLPLFVLMKQGKQVDKVVGAKTTDLQNKILLHKI